MVGTTLSHYRILELLGRGGMGEEYAAEDLKLRRRVALKVLPQDMADNAERRRRFEREAQAIASLNHPGIVTLYSVEHDKGRVFLTMELVEGRTLDDAVPRGGLPVADFLEIAIPLADAMYAAHERGILHRDLKPGNVMLTHDGRIKVLDFGLAKLVESAPAATLNAHGPLTTSSGQIVGTLTYMAPEQAEGRPMDHRADIFAIGVVLYELAAGIRPFAGESNVALLTSLLRDTPRPVTEMRRDLPPALAPIIQRCLEKDPARRYQTAAELRTDLQRLRDSLRPARRQALSPWAYPAAAGIMLTVGVAGWWTLREPTPSMAASPMAANAAEVRVLVTGRQVAMLDFTNETGDRTFDVLGRLVSEAMATSLPGEGYALVSATEASAGDGLTIAGSYCFEGDDVRIDVRVMSASRGSVLRVLDPVRGPRTSLPMTADFARQRIIAAIHGIFDAQPPGR
jgi:tRNA A-37 threonylcarbamoyl transferase component Bud32